MKKKYLGNKTKTVKVICMYYLEKAFGFTIFDTCLIIQSNLKYMHLKIIFC